MTISDDDLQRLYEQTLRAMNVRNYLLRKAQKERRELEETEAELHRAEETLAGLMGKSEAATAPKLPEE
jgi:hypothetical protein